MGTAMIISVGGTMEPIVFSIRKHRPEFVCFFASQETFDNAAKVKEMLKGERVIFDSYPAVVDDPNDLMRCYEKAGFTQEGQLREARYHEGRYINILMMSILKSDWSEEIKNGGCK